MLIKCKLCLICLLNMCTRFFDKKCWDSILHQNTAHLKLTHTFSIHCPSQFYRVSFMICQYCSQTYSRSSLNTKSCLYWPYVDFFKTEHISEKGGLQILFPETKLWNVENSCITIQAKYIICTNMSSIYFKYYTALIK